MLFIVMATISHLGCNHCCSCIASLVDTSGQHSPLFAVMIDGIPLFGPLGDSGSTLTRGTATSPSSSATTLDACGGHVDVTYPFYHVRLHAL